MKFLLDENVPYSLFKYLKEKGFDVVRAQDVRPGMSDEELLRKSLQDKRVLITLDKDFARLYFYFPTSTIVLISVHPSIPKNVVDAFRRVEKRADLLKNRGLIVVEKEKIRRFSLEP